MAIVEAKTVATLLGKQEESSSKGNTYVFDDDKVTVVFDTGADIVSVVIKFPQGRETVLRTIAGDTPTVFRQGKWVDYLKNLLKQVKENFKPIDDSEIFG
jgi:hypothetical protein